MLNYLKSKKEVLYLGFESIFTSDDEKQLLKILYYMLVIAALAAIFILGLNFYFGSISKEVGQFGDFFGGMLNPLLTFLTFFGLIATIVIQKQELKSARIEYEKTATALSTQAIETTFFNTLDLHHNITENLSLDILEIEGSNRLSLLQIASRNAVLGLPERQTQFSGRLVFGATLSYLTKGSQEPDSAVVRYREIQEDHNHVFGHYFRNLYQALKVIDGYSENHLTEGDKRKYTSILRAQLSTTEPALLLINCVDGVCDQGQFRNLLVKYSMLEHLPYELHDIGVLIAGETVIRHETFSQFMRIKVMLNADNDQNFGAFGKNGGSTAQQL